MPGINRAIYTAITPIEIEQATNHIRAPPDLDHGVIANAKVPQRQCHLLHPQALADSHTLPGGWEGAQGKPLAVC